jgi:hypothetical protein
MLEAPTGVVVLGGPRGVGSPRTEVYRGGGDLFAALGFRHDFLQNMSSGGSFL